MWTTAPYKQSQLGAAHALIRQLRLGTLVTEHPMDASPLPFLLDERRGPAGSLVGHLARANRQCASLAQGGQVLVAFTGPHTHVPARWYATSPRVSTWYYAAVHVYGQARLVTAPASVRNILERSAAAFDPEGRGWQPDSDYVERLLPAIVGVEIEITRIESQQRYGQDGPLADQQAVHEQLSAGDLNQQRVSQWMARAPGSGLRDTAPDPPAAFAEPHADD